MSDQTSTSTVGRLGHDLRSRRRALGMTQQEVAELASTTQRFVSTLETGKPTVRLDKLVDVTEVLGVTLLVVPHDRVAAVDELLGTHDGT